MFSTLDKRQYNTAITKRRQNHKLKHTCAELSAQEHLPKKAEKGGAKLSMAVFL